MEYLIDIFLNNLRQNNRSDYTIINYRNDLEKFKYWHQKHLVKPLKKTNSLDVSNFLQFLNGQKTRLSFWAKLRGRKQEVPLNLSVNSRKRLLSSLNTFFNFIMDISDKKYLKENPIKKSLHSIKLKEVDIEHTLLLEDKHYQRIMHETQDRKGRLIIKLLYLGGLRISELCILKFDDFNTNLKTIKLQRKGGKLHYLKVQSFHELFMDVQNYRFKMGLSNKKYLFGGKQDSPVTSRAMYSVIKRILKKSRLPNHTPHSFRKGCATKMYQESKDLLKVRDYLNHSDAKVTQTYIEI